jgi:glycosyltransferase domain-containing protein
MTNCTIIIPTYNRPIYLRRILDYYDSFGEGFKIIVADSSSDENKKINKDIISSGSNLDIQYLDSYPTEINPYHKIADMVNYAQEKYCVFCADDDFVTLNGIKKSVDFLEKNRDFTAAHGRYITFWLERGKNGQYFRWQSTYSALSIAFEHPEQRLTYHLSNYSPTFYAVHRSTLLKTLYKETLTSTVNLVLFGELLPSMLTLVYGKMKCVDVLYAVRQGYSTGNWPMTLRDAVRTGIYQGEYSKFRDCLSLHLSKQARLDIEESKKLVDEAMSAYMKKYCYPSKSKIGYISARMGRILDYLNLPDWLDRGIRRSYTRLVESRSTRKASIDMSPSSKYYDDFNRIRQHVFSSSGIIAK